MGKEDRSFHPKEIVDRNINFAFVKTLSETLQDTSVIDVLGIDSSMPHVLATKEGLRKCTPNSTYVSHSLTEKINTFLPYYLTKRNYALDVTLQSDENSFFFQYEYAPEMGWAAIDEKHQLQNLCIGSKFSINPYRYDQHGINHYVATEIDGHSDPELIVRKFLKEEKCIPKFLLPSFSASILCIPESHSVPFRRIQITLQQQTITTLALPAVVFRPLHARWIYQDTMMNAQKLIHLVFVEIGQFPFFGKNYSIWSQAESPAIIVYERSTQPVRQTLFPLPA